MSTNRQIEAGIPAARFSDLVVTEATNEVLVYDSVAHHIHKLNVTTAAVWRLCDGINDISDIGRLASIQLGTSVDDAMVRLALTQLADADLLIGMLPATHRVSRMTRRSFMQKTAVGGALAVPAIVSISAPVAANHNSDHACDLPCPNAAWCQDLAGCTLCVSPTGTNTTCEIPAPGVCGFCTKNGDCQGNLYDSTTLVKCNNCYCWNGSAWESVGQPLPTAVGVCWRNNTTPPGTGTTNTCGTRALAASRSAVVAETGTLTVTLVDEAGLGVSGTTLQLVGNTTYTAAEVGNGSVTFYDVTPGSYSLQLLAATGGATADAQQIEIVAGDNFAELTLTAVSVEEEEAVVPTQEPTQVPPTQVPPTPEPTSPPPPTPEPTSPPPPTPEPTQEPIVETNSDTGEGDQTETNPEG